MTEVTESDIAQACDYDRDVIDVVISTVDKWEEGKEKEE